MPKLLRTLRGAAASHETPVAWRHSDGTFISHFGDAWLYRVMPSESLVFEDPPARQAAADRLRAMLIDLGRTSRAGAMPGVALGARFREFHMLNLAWDEQLPPPESLPPALREWLAPAFSSFMSGSSLFAVGVKLNRASVMSAMNWRSLIQSTVSDAMGDEPDMMVWAADRSVVSGIMGRAGGRAPTDTEVRRLEAWWNGGRHQATGLVIAEPDGRRLSCDAWPEGLEIAALVGYEKEQFDPGDGLWLADAFGHSEGCVAVSVRGELWPAQSVRTIMRRTQRKAIAAIADQAATGDLAREEDENLRQTAQAVESVFAEGAEPLIRNASVLFARRASVADETYIDEMSTRWGLKIKVLEHRQVEGLAEMLPCAQPELAKIQPFGQDATVGVFAASGIGSYSAVGDDSGVWLGLSPPDNSPVWLDPSGASKQDKPPAMGVLGEPGAGKTFFLQLIATQAALAGRVVVFINPKPADSLDGFCKEIGGETIIIKADSDDPGMLDPFRYTRPAVAAEIARSHISCVFTDQSERDEVLLGSGLRQAAIDGARCVGEAMQHPMVPERFRELVFSYLDASPLFALGVSPDPRPRLGLSSGGIGLTLIEFDRPIPLPATAAPTSTYDLETRSSVAAVRLLTRAALEQMFQMGGGVLILDEAHVFLGSQEGRAIIQRLGREGRSQQILPILATQRISDVISEGVDMGSYLGRVLVMKMTDEVESKAALKLCQLEPTEERLAMMRMFGPVRGERGSYAFYRDLLDRCSLLGIGPIPADVAQLFSTNPLDREARANASKDP